MTQSQNLTSAQVTSAINAINAEKASFNSLCSAAKRAAESNESTAAMLRIICRHYLSAQGTMPSADIEKRLSGPVVGMSPNDIKKAVIYCFPEKEGNTLLQKKGEVYVPFVEYSAVIIKKAYMCAIGAKKAVKGLRKATDEEVQAIAQKAEEKKAAAAAKRESAKESAALYEKFYREVMAAVESGKDSDILDVVRTYATAAKAACKGVAASKLG